MSRLNELIRKMIDEAPVEFRDSQLVYVKELAKIYATEVAQSSLEKASENAELCTIALENGEYKIDKESIINFENINIL